MPATSPRRFTIADVMILVAAAALGFLLMRVYFANRTLPGSGYTPPFLWKYAAYVSPILLVWPSALLAARAIPPRPSPRMIFRQPGTVACLAALIQTMIHETFMVGRSYLRPEVQFVAEWHAWMILRSGYSVALAWMFMAIVGVWRPEASWVDRAGRALGVLLIVLWIFINLTL